MTKTQATRQARREVSRIYRVAAGRGSVTWGFDTVSRVQTNARWISSIGSYRDAQIARAEWIADRAAELIEYDMNAPRM